MLAFGADGVATFFAVLSVFPLLFIVFGIVVIVRYGVLDRQWWAAMQTRAVRTDAVVTGHRTITSINSGSPGGYRAPSYQAKVRFTLPDGTEQQARTRYTSPEQPRDGDPLAILYDPERPSRVVHADGPGSQPPPRGVVFVMGILAIVMGWILFVAFRLLADLA